MSMFAGVSMVIGGEVHATPSVSAGTDSGYHLLVVKDYSRTVQEKPNGKSIRSGTFMVGGHQWYLKYYPNGEDPSCADFISLEICLGDDDDGMEEAVEVKFEFSFVDQVELQMPMHIQSCETRSFIVKSRCWSCMEFRKRDAFEGSPHLKADCFTIRCDIRVCNDLNTQDADGTLPKIHDHFDHLLQNMVGADVAFEVNGEKFAAHRCVLAARSEVFMAQLFGPMMEGTTSSIIEIKDMEPKVFWALLRFIYTDLFPEMETDNNVDEEEGKDEEEEKDEEEGQEADVMWLQDLLVAADRYDLQRLKFLCEKQLSNHIRVSSVASTLALAEQHHCHRLKEVCFKFIQTQSPECLNNIMATDGWDHIISTYPSVLNELVAKLVSNQKQDKKRKR